MSFPPLSRSIAWVLAMILACGLLAARAQAHPHVWITVETTILHDKGTFIGVRHKWTFDEFYTAMAIEGLDKNNDGKYDRDELSELAKVNIEGLKEFAYFTHAALAGKDLELGEARDYWLEHTDGNLSLNFTLLFAKPVLTEAKGLTVSVYDPTFFIAFDFAKTNPVKLSEGAPKGCEAKLGGGEEAGGTQTGSVRISAGRVIAIDCAGP